MSKWLFCGSGKEESDSSSSSQRADSSREDGDLLDAYSQAVVHVVDSVAPSVLSLSHSKRRNGFGSGFLITPDGLAITNSHVVAGAKELMAETMEGDLLGADVVGDDPPTDVALLRLARISHDWSGAKASDVS